MRKYGFGDKTGIDLAGENVGVVPSPEWKAKRSKEGWYPGETVNAGIGQGYWIATVLQLVRGTAAIANGGALHPLHLVMSTRDGYNGPWRATPHPPGPRITESEQHLRAVQEGMIATVHGGGTAAAVGRGIPYLMAAKTGTAQKVSRRGNVSSDPHSLPYNLRHQALFVAYAPADNPRIAIAVSVEHGGYGASSAGPIARKVFDAWLLGKMPAPEEGVMRSPQGGAPLDYVPPADVAPTVAKPAPAPAKAVPATTPPALDDDEPAPESASPTAQARGEAAARKAAATLQALQAGAR
jgi:penicillin-binding protein 2